jgi:hypothetical protein
LQLQETSLHLACSNGKEDCAELLIAHGAAVDSIDEVNISSLCNLAIQVTTLVIQSGFTPLHKATEKRYTNIVHMLLHNRCVLNSKNKLGRTSLHGAVLKGYMDVVVQLLQSGAEANTATEVSAEYLHHCGSITLNLQYVMILDKVYSSACSSTETTDGLGCCACLQRCGLSPPKRSKLLLSAFVLTTHRTCA